MKNIKKKKGFTLVELIVVIAIIGVLAAILIPTLIGYIDQAKKANDRTIAKSLYDRVQMVLTEDWAAYQAFFYGHTSGEMSCTEDGYCYRGWDRAQPGEYKLVVVCMINGASNADNNEKYYKWHPCNQEKQLFTAMFNKNLGLTINYGEKKYDGYNRVYYEEVDGDQMKNYKNMPNNFIYNMKYTDHPNGDHTDRWLVCYRQGTKRIEIWAGCTAGYQGTGHEGASQKVYGNTSPYCRIYPEPCEDYK